MTLTDTTPTITRFAGALTAFGAFLADHPDLPALAHIGVVAKDDGSVTIYPSHTREAREPSPAHVEHYTATWATALGTTVREQYTHTNKDGTPYISRHAERQIAPGVTVYALFTADLDPADPAPAAG